MSSDEEARLRKFEQVAMPHLDAAYNLARWLAGTPQDADDIVQEAMLRAFRFIEGYRGTDGSGRAWLLTIVRNAAYSWFAHARPTEPLDLDDDPHCALPPALVEHEDPELLLLRNLDARLLDRLIGDLPAPFREVLILRDVEDLSYREIAGVTGAPVGTVMSRLARARRQLRERWLKAQE